MNAKCCFGFHRWEQSRPISVMDAFPPPFVRYERVTRHCTRCDKSQWWLPGYGGSEIGCWVDGVRKAQEREGAG